MEGQDAIPDAVYPEQEWIYYYCAKEFGWTIEETDNQPAYFLDWVIEISKIVSQVENDKQQLALSNQSSKQAN